MQNRRSLDCYRRSSRDVRGLICSYGSQSSAPHGADNRGRDEVLCDPCQVKLAGLREVVSPIKRIKTSSSRFHFSSRSVGPNASGKRVDNLNDATLPPLPK